MTPYGVVITVLLISPWVLIGVVILGAAIGRLQTGRRSGIRRRFGAEREQRDGRPGDTTANIGCTPSIAGR